MEQPAPQKQQSESLKWVAICFAGLLLLIGKGLFAPSGHPAVSDLIVAEAPAGATKTLSILFLGNSYIFHNGMPVTLAKLAGSDLGSHVKLEMRQVVQGGVNLTELWDTGVPQKVLGSRHWDYVALHQQSFWPLSAGGISETFDIYRTMKPEFETAHAKPAIFVSWPRKPGSKIWYDQATHPYLKSPEDVAEKFTRYSNQLAKTVDGIVVPVGNYWMMAMAENSGVPLYAGDDAHPSALGSYLAALVFYKYLIGGNPLKTTYVPAGVTQEQAQAMRKIAARKLSE